MRCFLMLGLLLALAMPLHGEQKKAAANCYFKVEVKGSLKITDKVEVVSATLGQELEKQPVNAVVSASGITMYLRIGDNKELAELAKKLDGKPVLITGEQRRAYEGPISGLYPPRFDDYIQVTTLKAAE